MDRFRAEERKVDEQEDRRQDRDPRDRPAERLAGDDREKQGRDHHGGRHGDPVGAASAPDEPKLVETRCSTPSTACSIAVLGEPEFVERLKSLGYTMIDGSRLRRPTEHGEAFIDLIAPAPASRALHNQPAGRFRVDQFPGVQHALNEPPIIVDIEAVPLEGSPSSPFRVAVPTVPPAIVVKALAARTRQKDKDDLHRLLLVADPTSTALPSPPYDNLDIGSAAEYLHGPFLTGTSQHTRSLVDKTVPRPPERPTFANL